LVQRSIYEKFMDRALQRVVKVKQGHPLDATTMIGAQASNDQLEKILSYIEIGKGEGARVLTGGKRASLNGELASGYYVEPTVLEGHNKMRVFQEEIFGPVLAITKARDFDHALQLANDTEYGLTGAVYSNNSKKVEKAKKQFFVGNLYINRKCTGAMVGAHPFGGFHMSGTDSKAGGPDYLLQFVQAKSIAEKVG
jgi:acyl-CoA reductase-like NAD-dependent aldehyde dehydrogenase